MLQRFVIHLTLIVLFAFTQVGVATHEISHVFDADTHDQQHKNTAAEQCEQCISYAKVASGLPLSGFDIPEMVVVSSATVDRYNNFHSRIASAYAARAPPQIIS